MVRVLPVPHTSLVVPFGTVRPAGSVSVQPTPLSATGFAAGLVRVKVSDVVVVSGIVAAPNALARVGGAATATSAVAVLPVPPLVELTLPLVLVRAPALVP